MVCVWSLLVAAKAWTPWAGDRPNRCLSCYSRSLVDLSFVILMQSLRLDVKA